MNNTQNLNNTSLSRLTFTRFIAAMIVVIYHFGSSTWPFSSDAMRWFVNQGQASVSYFYCLSGFIMSVVYSANNSTPLNKKSFWVARIARIYPCFLISILFGSYYYSGRNLQETIEIAIGLQPWIFDRLSHVNPPAWSIGVEVFFYILFPFTIMAFTTSRIKIAGIFTVLLWVLTMVFSVKTMTVPPSPEGVYFNMYNPLMHLNEFFFGVLAGSFLTIKRSRPLRLLHPAVPFSLLCGLLIARSINGFPNINGLSFANGALAPLFVWLIASIANSKQSTLNILNRRPFVLLGEASYAMYILHYPLRLWFITNIPEVLKRSPLTELLIYCTILIVLSILVHIAFENPLRTMIRKMLSTERKNEHKLNESAVKN